MKKKWAIRVQEGWLIVFRDGKEYQRDHYPGLFPYYGFSWVMWVIEFAEKDRKPDWVPKHY